MATFGVRALNRTLLARQFLDDRVPLTALEAVEHLVAVQGQFPNSPYIGLWARVTSFRRDDLAALLEDRKVVRSITLRRTVHLSSSEDFAWLRPVAQPVVRNALQSAFYAEAIEGLDLDELRRAGRELLTGKPLTRKAFGSLLAERFPGRHGGRLVDTVEVLEALVHAPRNGAWGGWRHPSNVAVALAEEQTGLPMSEERRLETLVRRYLAAFGPASVMDVQAWSGLTRLREPIEAMRPALRVSRGEDGKELFDLPDAPLGDPDRPVPVRFLPAFDNALLGHRDRTRIISEADRKRYAAGASGGVPMFLVDGFAAGTWSVQGGTVTVTPTRPLREADAAAVHEAGSRLLEFILPDEPDRRIVFADAVEEAR
ncbi:winged helix DNA-binding domain-containing protein [Glycomyces sp. TRM65418]|uniref:winged helix DNA-binding domain-containing protein n=1 Tax=Glycomyces sp. TRM65418 TaxID=2867006 RepID=UPI001D166C9F|nr:winged helix DNA-binding domain-containing protein [Glycomyces sp. TRM65418]MCC3763450.1 winged helix DNA-binding domain-containing protein [Glycomyces sp. TRM65418]